MLDARFIAPTHAKKSEPLKTVLIELPPSSWPGPGYRLWQVFVSSFIPSFRHQDASHNIGNGFLDLGGGKS
jgi:hypothetical protein